ncbi:SNF2 domain-containing protein CLASSY 3 [Morella rubra]|uniref:SNF2 domain-containing protein CLASSY 3 n=1 Tax=Morella rubra TaxID=262757 RepID=A0A6A1V063_9ROSI|nr:SNF2 domain-containing protein CLASSY 3 [Morella rubra]
MELMPGATLGLWLWTSRRRCRRLEHDYHKFTALITTEGFFWDKDKDVVMALESNWDTYLQNIAGGIYVDKLKNQTNFPGGSVCIVSSAPGYGKTCLTIVFLQTYLKLNLTCRPIIVAPCSMLLIWEEEIRKWKYDIPFHNLKDQVLLAWKVG